MMLTKTEMRRNRAASRERLKADAILYGEPLKRNAAVGWAVSALVHAGILVAAAYAPSAIPLALAALVAVAIVAPAEKEGGAE